MPVIFKTPTSHEVLMLDKDAEKMLKLMKTSGTIPSALYPEDVKDALEALQQHLEQEHVSGEKEQQEENENNEHVSLDKKAWPLIELMQRAIENNEKLIWNNG